MNNSLPDSPKDLTAGQLQYLASIKSYVVQSPTILKLIRKSVRNFAILTVLIGGLAGLYAAMELWGTALFLLGMLAGCFCRDCGMMRRFIKIWPALASVIDWSRVDKLLGEASVEPHRNIK